MPHIVARKLIDLHPMNKLIKLINYNKQVHPRTQNNNKFIKHGIKIMIKIYKLENICWFGDS